MWKAPSANERLAALGLLLVLAAQLAWAVKSDGLTIDELVYVGSGYRHASAADYRLNAEQPPLSKMLGAVPLLFLDLHVPESADGDSEWGWSYRFVQVDNARAPVIPWARVPVVLLTVTLAMLLWWWARGTHGPVAGLAALALTVFHPSVLAHGHFLTTDMAGTLTMVAASLAFWRWWQAPGPARAVLVALALGVAVAARLTGWLLVPSFVLLAALGWLRADPDGRRRRLRQVLSLTALGLVVVPIVIWAAYGFRYAPWPGSMVAQVPGPHLGTAGRLIAALESVRALPEAYLEGARFVVEHNATGHPTYLLGQTSIGGWPHYYLVAFAVKNTLGFLLAVAATLFLLRGRLRDLAGGSLEAHWIVPAAWMFVAASAGRIQIGERYILPVYPYLILLAASAAPRLVATSRGRALAGAVLALHAVPCLFAASGGYLSYFNLLAGGRAGGHRVLADSNLDWGQDLPRLAEWMRRHHVPIVQLGYHGSDDPARYGIVREDLPGMHLNPARPPDRPFAGTVAVSPNLLLGIFYPPDKNPYEALRQRAPDDRAGVYFIYRSRTDGPGVPR